MGKVDGLTLLRQPVAGTVMEDSSHSEWQLTDYTALIKQEFNM